MFPFQNKFITHLDKKYVSLSSYYCNSSSYGNEHCYLLHNYWKTDLFFFLWDKLNYGKELEWGLRHNVNFTLSRIPVLEYDLFFITWQGSWYWNGPARSEVEQSFCKNVFKRLALDSAGGTFQIFSDQAPSSQYY